MIGPSRRIVTALVLAAAPGILGLWIPGAAAAGWAILGLVVLAAGADLFFLPRRGAFEAAIEAAPVLSLADEQPVTVRVRNRTGLARPGMLRLVVPEAWEASRSPVGLPLGAHAEGETAIRVRPTKRGRYTVGPVWLRWLSPAGFFWRDYRLDASTEVKVYPAVSSIRKFALLSRRLRTREMGLRTQRVRGQGMEFARLRETVPDDDLRVIDWKASARRGRFISREYQVERCQNIVLMVDTGRMLTEEVDGLVKIEYALNAALLLTRIAAEYDDRVGTVVFSETVERWAVPRKGRAAVPAVAEALFDVEPRICEADYEGAFAHLNARYRKRALVVLLTNVIDQETSGMVTACLRALTRRHVPLLVALGDRETRDLAHAAPERPEDLHLKGAAAHLVLSRSRTLRDLQRRGVHVIDAPAGRVPVELVNKYLDLKSRQIL